MAELCEGMEDALLTVPIEVADLLKMSLGLPGVRGCCGLRAHLIVALDGGRCVHTSGLHSFFFTPAEALERKPSTRNSS